MDRDLFLGHKIKGYVTVVDIIIGKPFLYNALLVSRTDHEIVISKGGIVLHNVPKHGHTADLDHGLGTKMRFFTDACAESARQNNHFHVYALLFFV